MRAEIEFFTSAPFVEVPLAFGKRLLPRCGGEEVRCLRCCARGEAADAEGVGQDLRSKSCRLERFALQTRLRRPSARTSSLISTTK